MPKEGGYDGAASLEHAVRRCRILLCQIGPVAAVALVWLLAAVAHAQDGDRVRLRVAGFSNANATLIQQQAESLGARVRPAMDHLRSAGIDVKVQYMPDGVHVAVVETVSDRARPSDLGLMAGPRGTWFLNRHRPGLLASAVQRWIVLDVLSAAARGANTALVHALGSAQTITVAAARSSGDTIEIRFHGSSRLWNQALATGNGVTLVHLATTVTMRGKTHPVGYLDEDSGQLLPMEGADGRPTTTALVMEFLGYEQEPEPSQKAPPEITPQAVMTQLASIRGERGREFGLLNIVAVGLNPQQRAFVHQHGENIATSIRDCAGDRRYQLLLYATETVGVVAELTQLGMTREDVHEVVEVDDHKFLLRVDRFKHLRKCGIVALSRLPEPPDDARGVTDRGIELSWVLGVTRSPNAEKGTVVAMTRIHRRGAGGLLHDLDPVVFVLLAPDAPPAMKAQASIGGNAIRHHVDATSVEISLPAPAVSANEPTITDALIYALEWTPTGNGPRYRTHAGGD